MTKPDKLQARTARKSPNDTFQDPDPNDPDIIMPEVKLTRWDKASRKLRDLLAKREALPADHAHHTVSMLDHQIDRARQAVKNAENDLTRKREGIDDWRAGDGRETYNAGRRKVRHHPNADLTALAEAEKKRRKLDQTNDSRFVTRRREAGMSEVQIQAELVVYIRAREAKRAAEAQADEDQATLEKNAMFGMF